MGHLWRVLVVSDDERNRDVLSAVLSHHNISVASSSSFLEAQEILARDRFDLAFCDARLPGGSYRDLLTDSPDAPRVVVVLPAESSREYLEAVRAGAFAVVHYPLSPQDIEMVVMQALREQLTAVTYEGPVFDNEAEKVLRFRA